MSTWAGIEPEPAHPQHTAANRSQQDVVRLEHLQAEAAAVAQEHGGHKPGHARGNMDGVSTGKVEHS